MADRLPQFQTLDELVAFWDDHDFTDYVDEMEEVGDEGLPGQKKPALRIVLDSYIWERLSQLAGQRGISLDQLARQWLEERIAHEVA